jgi:hypothetical protein
MSILPDRRVLATACGPVRSAAEAFDVSLPMQSESGPALDGGHGFFPGGTYNRWSAFLAYGEPS